MSLDRASRRRHGTRRLRRGPRRPSAARPTGRASASEPAG